MPLDERCDVIIVGCGFAGAVAAIAAHDQGADVVILEKMPDPGGISVCSFGGVRVAHDAGKALQYLQRTNGGTAPDAVLAALATGMTGLPGVLQSLAEAVGRRTRYRPFPANYPFPGCETFAGVEIEARGGRRRIGARRGVVLACGGFEGDAAMQRQYWPEQPVLSAAFRGNTGDGIRMAQAMGADLWHMWHYHGSYGFRHSDQAYPFGIRTKRLPDWRPGAPPGDDVRLPWILLDKRARRFMNEYDPYLQDTGARPFQRYEPLVQDFAAIPAWLISDRHGAALWPFGQPTWHERGVGFEWGADNSAALEAGILKRAESIAELAQATGLSLEALTASLSRWNALVARRLDEEWGRPPASMVEIRHPPFIYAPVWPIVSNTQGGPVHDARQRAVRPDGVPIPRFFTAGELGSVFGHLYMSGGNIAECFVGGAIAGCGAATITEHTRASRGPR